MSVEQSTPVREPERKEAASWRDILAVIGVRVGGVLRRIIAVIRPIAWVLIGAMIVLWVLGQMFGWNEFTIAALVVAVVLALSALFLIGGTAYDISLDLARNRVVVGERAVGGLKLANNGPRAILPSRIVLPVGSGRGEFSIGRLAPGAESEELFAIPTQRRAVVQVGPVSVVRGDPLGLFERLHERDDPTDLYVHPRTVRFEGQTLGFMRDLEGLPAADLSRDDVSFHALNEYQPGDDIRHVHWRSSARTGTMMVRHYEETRRSHFVIGLSLSSGDYRTDDEFETAISAAGSIGLRAISDSHRVDLRVQGRELPAGTGKRMLDSLSGVDATRPREGDIAALAGVISATMPLASIVVLVCGSRVSNATLQVACSRLPFGARALAIVVDDTLEQPELRRIADADVISIGNLEQLPIALMRVLA